ncbi:MAG: helix-turn-helix transcriptional regulator [Pseudomonadota bacterium]
MSRIANEVASNLSHGACTLPQISAKLGMSQRAVQRLLEKEGTSFRKLSEEIRRSAAERYLRSTDLPMKEIAYLLGFSELSTFSRAVKTWFGVSPRKVREASLSPCGLKADPDRLAGGVRIASVPASAGASRGFAKSKTSAGVK